MLQAVNALTQGEDLLQVGVTGLGAGNDNQRQYMLSESQAATGVSFKLNAKAPVVRTVLVTGAPASAPPAMSVFVSTSRSATATCFTASS